MQWNLDTGQKISDFPLNDLDNNYDPKFCSLVLRNDGLQLAIGLYKNIFLFDMTINKVIYKLNSNQSCPILAYHPEGKQLATSNWWNNKTLFWDPNTGEMQYQLKGCLADYSPDGRYVATIASITQNQVFS